MPVATAMTYVTKARMRLSSFFRKAGIVTRAQRIRIAADRLRNEGQWKDAAAMYGAYLEIRKHDFAIHVQLGHALKEVGDFIQADAAYERAQALKADDADLLLSRGHLSRINGDLTAAVRYYRSSCRMDVSSPACDELNDPALAELLRDAHLREFPPSNRRSNRISGSVAVRDGQVKGWAMDLNSPTDLLDIEVRFEQTAIGFARTGLVNPERSAMDRDNIFAGFKLDLKLDSAAKVHVFANEVELSGSPVIVEPEADLAAWLETRRLAPHAALKRMTAGLGPLAPDRLLSIILPVRDPPLSWLASAIESVRDQWSGQWELIIVDDGSVDPAVRQYLNAVAQDPRTRLLTASCSEGIAAAMKCGIATARGDFVAFLDHDDFLEPDAVWRMLSAGNPSVDLVYSDEAITTENIHVFRSFVMRPAFSWYYYLSHPYFVHFVAIRTALARSIHLDETLAISSDVNLVLRVIEKANAVAHVPAILYRWRTHGGSTGHRMKSIVSGATVKALTSHLDRISPQTTVSPGARFNCYRIDFPKSEDRVAILIPTRDRADLLRQCISSLRATADLRTCDVVIVDNGSQEAATFAFFREAADVARVVSMPGPFNFSLIHNRAVRTLQAPLLLFLNNDIEAIASGWLDRLRSLAIRPDVGAVGATLIYGNRTIQHAGVVIGLGGPAEHSHKFAHLESEGRRNYGYNASLLATRDFSAVTAACMMMRKEIFEAVGGFDEDLPVGFNDTDLCLRLGNLGYSIVKDAESVLYHHESQTRRNAGHIDHPEDAVRFERKWAKILAEGDPFYNPLLSKDPGHENRPERLANWLMPPRVRTGIALKIAHPAANKPQAPR